MMQWDRIVITNRYNEEFSLVERSFRWVGNRGVTQLTRADLCREGISDPRLGEVRMFGPFWLRLEDYISRNDAFLARRIENVGALHGVAA